MRPALATYGTARQTIVDRWVVSTTSSSKWGGGGVSGAAASFSSLPFSFFVASSAMCSLPSVVTATPLRCGGPPVREHVVLRSFQPDRERTREHGGVAEARDLDLRRVRQPLLEQIADRSQQEIAVRCDPSAEHDETDVRDGCDRDDVERDSPRHLFDDRPRDAVARSSGGEDRAGIVRRSE